MGKHDRSRRGRSRRTIDGGTMLAAYERTAIDYYRNILVGTRIGRQAKPGTFETLEEGDTIAATAVRSIDPTVVPTRSSDPEKEWQKRWRAIDWSGHRPSPIAPLEEPIRGNLHLLGTLIGLDEMEGQLLQFLVIQALVPQLVSLTDLLGDVSLLGAADVLAAATARTRDELVAVLMPKSRLPSSGIVLIEEETMTLQHKVGIAQGALIDLMLRPGLDRVQLLDHLLPTAPDPTLGSDDYPHLAGEVALAQRLLGEALRLRRPGVNLLLYGETGTGKSELARLLARANGASLHVAGKEDDWGESADASERMASLLLGNRLLASGSSVLLFDEIEDLFTRSALAGLLGGDRRDTPQASKQWLNLLLETNPVPTIWISNDVWGMDPAFRRRFAYAIEFKHLSVTQRRRVWQRHLGGATALALSEIDLLAERFTVSPGQIATALTTARLVSGCEPDRPTIEKVVAPLEKLVRGEDPRPRHFVEASYLFEAASASCDLRALADRLAAWQPGEGPGVSLCLYGPPGTGKSEYVHCLARRMGRRVLVLRVSDILSKWVGEAERNIAEAFHQADRDAAVLLFDEADSFLRDRRLAHNSWEVTGVNEFLQQLEAHRGVVACTTNLYRDIDQASLRRFVFKIEFGFLKPEQALLLYRSRLEPLLPTPPSSDQARQVEQELARLPNLTPGDFAAVARRLRVGGAEVGGGKTAVALVEELRAEARAKEGPARSIGFS